MMPAENSDNLSVRVTKIDGRWHSRVFIDGILRSEMACELRQDIGWICREQLRRLSKLGTDSAYAKAARMRQTDAPVGKVWAIPVY